MSSYNKLRIKIALTSIKTSIEVINNNGNFNIIKPYLFELFNGINDITKNSNSFSQEPEQFVYSDSCTIIVNPVKIFQKIYKFDIAKFLESCQSHLVSDVDAEQIVLILENASNFFHAYIHLKKRDHIIPNHYPAIDMIYKF